MVGLCIRALSCNWRNYIVAKIIQYPTDSQVVAAWAAARALPTIDSNQLRLDRYGAAIEHDKLGNASDRFGWFLIETDTGQVEAVNTSIKIPLLRR
jgi:hypothetical protein